MKVILLAAGLGTRLKPLTDYLPKCLVQINGKALLKIWIENIHNANIDEILINTHYLPDMVLNFLKSEGYLEKIKVVYEPKLLGTAGTIFKNINFFSGEAVMVIHADNLSKFNINEFILAHKNRPPHCNMTMMLFETDDPKSCGIVELDITGVVVGFYEKICSPPSKMANAAIYILEPELVLECLSMNPIPTDISNELIPRNLGRIFTYINTQYHRDIGTIESLRLANIEYFH